MEPGSNWSSLGEDLDSGAATASWGTDEVQVFVIRRDASVWDTFWDGAAWHEWHSHGGSFRGQPAACGRDDGRIDLFAVTVDGKLMHRLWDGTAWIDWTEVEGAPVDAKEVTCEWCADRLDVFVRGSDDRLWHRGMEV